MWYLKTAIYQIHFDGGSIYRVEFKNSKLIGVRFDDCILKNVLFKDVLGKYSNFSFSKFKIVSILDSNFENSVFQEVKVTI